MLTDDHRMSLGARFRAVLRGERPDRLPWFPRLSLWYSYHAARGSLPERFRGAAMREIEEAVGGGVVARRVPLFRKEYRGIEVREEREENRLRRTFITPIGTVSEAFIQNDDPGRNWHDDDQPFVETWNNDVRTEYMIKSPEDYEVVRKIAASTVYKPLEEEGREYAAAAGENSAVMADAKNDPMFDIVHNIVGVERAAYDMVDRPNAIDDLYRAMADSLLQLDDILVRAPVDLILHGVNFDVNITPPRLFDRYIGPYLKRVADLLHSHGKFLAVHPDGEVAPLMDSFLAAGIDLADCLCTRPMSSLSLSDVHGYWGEQVAIWGGIPSTALCPDVCSEDEFHRWVDEAFTAAERGTRLVLGIVDNVMPQADVERLAYIGEEVERRAIPA